MPTPSDRISIFLADDHAIVRSGLRLLIETQSDFQLVGEGASWTDALEQIPRIQPHVAILDLSMPGSDAMRCLHLLKKAAPATCLLVLSMHEEPVYVRAAIAAGAAGYVVKSAADEELMTAVRTVASGKMHLSAPLERRRAEPAPGDRLAATAALSERERDVLQFVARGMTNREIAEKLALSVKTVESYRARSMAKLDLKSRAELVRFAVKNQLISWNQIDSGETDALASDS